MRKIIFRGLTAQGEWIYGDLDTSTRYTIIRVHDHSLPYGAKIVLEETVGQFIGCQDKNGIDIYDGDVHSEQVECDGKMIDCNLPVVFDEGAYWLDESSSKDGSLLTLLCEYEDAPINIIGNIHQKIKEI
jgi:hypothetical protein